MFLLLALACSDKDSTETGDLLAVDSSAQDRPGPCDGSWDEVDGWVERETALHVSPTGQAEGVGSLDDPFDSLATALTWARENQPGADIVLWPGTYSDTAAVLFAATEQGIDDSGSSIVGCGTGSTILVGTTTAATLDVVGVTDITLRGFTIQGGYRGLQIHGGADLQAESLVIDGATRIGALVDGPATQARLANLTVKNTALDEGAFGWGIAVQDATVALEEPTIQDVHTVGLLVHFGNATVSGGSITGVSADPSGLYGRGVQLQALSSGSLSGLQVQQTQDAGIFAHRTVSLDVNDIWVVDTGAGLTEEGGTPTGDGLVVTQAEGNFDPAEFQVSVTDSVFENSARAGVLIDGATAELSGVTTPGAGLTQEGLSVFGQNDAQVSGDAVQAQTPLGLNLGTLKEN